MNTDDILRIIAASPKLQCAIIDLHLQAHGDIDDPDTAAALDDLSSDPYFDILPLRYNRGKSLQAIAHTLFCDRSTAIRHRRDLLLRLYHACCHI